MNPTLQKYFVPCSFHTCIHKRSPTWCVDLFIIDFAQSVRPVYCAVMYFWIGIKCNRQLVKSIMAAFLLEIYVSKSVWKLQKEQKSSLSSVHVRNYQLSLMASIIYWCINMSKQRLLLNYRKLTRDLFHYVHVLIILVQPFISSYDFRLGPSQFSNVI